MHFPAVQKIGNRLRFDKVKQSLKVITYLRHSVLVQTAKTVSVDGTQRAAVDDYASTGCYLDLLIPKSNQHIYEFIDICDQNWVKFPSLVCEIWCSQGFRVIACGDLDFWSRKIINTSTNPNTSVTKIGWNSLHWVVRYGVHKVFGSLSVSYTHLTLPTILRV